MAAAEVSESVLVMAHRGASAKAPENTAAAIRLAIAQQADMIEVDVQLTRDRRVVVFHDERLERTTSGQGLLRAHRYAELARLDCGSWFAPRFASERILLLSQALRLTSRTCILNIELKRSPRAAELVTRVARCVASTRSVRRVLVSSFDSAMLRRFRLVQPRASTALLCVRHPEAALRLARRLGCAALHPHVSIVTPAVVAQAHQHGLRVHAWTSDQPREAIRLRRMGVDGLVTNDPGRLRAACQRAPA